MADEVTEGEVIRLATRAAHKARGNHGPFELDDVRQAALEGLYEVWPKLTIRTPGYVYRVLERAAARWAAKERYDVQLSTAQYVYTAREVRALLEEAYFLPDAWTAPTAKDTPDATWIETGTVAISLFDLRTAIHKLSDRYRELILRSFVHKEELEPADRRALNRAIQQLTRSLNLRVFGRDRVQEPRTAMSNGHAHWYTSAELGQAEPRDRHEKDALSQLQAERSAERSDPPGTHFNWNRHA